MALVALKAGMFPDPLATSPIDGVLFVHVKETPPGVPEKFTAVVLVPAHTVWFVGWTTDAGHCAWAVKTDVHARLSASRTFLIKQCLVPIDKNVIAVVY
ncbi:hypothetical protein GCM10023184_43350 [Flaviaesturariibacter amylovorans]|uniref:Uncharacterized protein n=1 Tax=Flaviaesturariibacter amylovorans TaxID=1084520 RepID=A0ABP8HRL2_9BACT